MERVALFLDHANLQGAFNALNTQIDYVGLKNYLSDGRFLVEAFVYIPVHPERQEKACSFIEFLQHKGFFVRPKLGKKAGDRWKCNVNMEMTIDILRYTYSSKADIIVIGAGDGDLAPLVQEVRYNGIRCEITSTPATAARELILAASGFIDLSVVVQEGFLTINPSVLDEEGLSSYLEAELPEIPDTVL